MDISGKVIQILPKQTGAGKNGPWEKQDYVIEIQGTYPKKVCFNLWGNKISQFDIKEGEFINIGLDIESREYQGRWYTDVRFWKIEGAASSQENFSQEAPSLNTNTEFSQESFSDDLPF